MPNLKYFRPTKMDDALELIQKAEPLAGGTSITPRRDSIPQVVDVQDLGMDEFHVEGERIEIGAACKLQSLIEHGKEIPGALLAACRLEAGLNMRQMSSLAGTLVEADGRSSLLTALMVMDASVLIEPGTGSIPLEKFLQTREKPDARFLITKVILKTPKGMAFEYVARAPADRPIVCAAAALHGDGESAKIWIALGGYGTGPIRVHEAEEAVIEGRSLDKVSEAATRAYAQAEDAFASAEYRAHVAGVLVQRVLKEVRD
jgi:carbon-monoxide dehydrogenase medium subunit